MSDIVSENGNNGRRRIAAICAILLGIVFLVSGGWKVIQPFQTGELLEQAQVPGGWGPSGAAVLGTLELFAAALLFVPQLRRLGGLLSAALMVFFIGWIGHYYPVLVGHECSCFPILKRTVGPGFFVGDGIMLLMAVAAFVWSPAVRRMRVPATVLGSLAVFAGLSFGLNVTERGHVAIPRSVVVDGKAQDLTRGKVFVFFYDPSCEHCDAASRFMSTLNWGDTRIVAVPTVNPQWAESFLHDTHLKAGTSKELAKLKTSFPFVDPPYGVALVDGYKKETFGQAQFNKPLPEPELKKLGFVN